MSDDIPKMSVEHIAGNRAMRAEQDIPEAMDTLKKSMADTEPGSYAHGWHCNIAMMCYDAIMAETGESFRPMIHDQAHKIGNDAASRFMKLCFDVETSND